VGAQRGALANGQDGGKPVPLDSQQPGPGDAVDTAVESVQPARGNPRAQRVPAHSKLGELDPRHHTVLPLRQGSHRQIESTCSSLCGHIPQKGERVGS
jgi:hypothetical protein